VQAWVQRPARVGDNRQDGCWFARRTESKKFGVVGLVGSNHNLWDGRRPARTARHGTARHGTARHGTARHGTNEFVFVFVRAAVDPQNPPLSVVPGTPVRRVLQ
jgi:hypothetical protein